ncbi:MAG TPA: Npt1/Npt2 family nucleotide transporter [Gemmatimonadota bacterium]|nr:Npt1/Npt2 family nucleotide transporter [Gemmatimonadota bacterium]
MKAARRLAEWLGVREAEVGMVLLSFGGAFLVMSFLVLARALREAAYLDLFDASTLPYVMGGVVALSFPAAGAFSKALDLVNPRRAMRALSLLLAVAVAAIWPFLTGSSVGVVVFYLVTAVGTVLLTSGFWLVVSEMLVVREAKRLFGLISAGGTLGVLVTGLAVGATVEHVEPSLLVPVLVFLLLASAALNEFVPRDRMSLNPTGPTPPWTESVVLIARDDHVRTLTLVVLLVAALGTIVDFQFKEAAQNALGGERELAAFFGAFYGWTGGFALLVQLFLTTRIMTRGGVTMSIVILPMLILVLSVGMLVAPGLVMATGLRGTDSTLKKSLFRSVVEFLWVPVRTDVRRRTKAFVDTMAENAGDGLGALIVLLIVTLGGMPSRYLSPIVMLLCLALLVLARRMGREYFTTLRARLAEGLTGDTLAALRPARDARGPRTLSRLDVTRLLSSVERGGAYRSDGPGAAATGGEASEAHGDEVWTMLPALDDDDLRRRLDDPAFVEAANAGSLALLLARDGLRDLAARRLAGLGESAGPELAAIVADEEADFVVRRRVAQVLAFIPGEAALDGLLTGLAANRFEVRYRAARALVQGRKGGESLLPEAKDVIWDAIRQELSRGRAVWELARLLDPKEHDELAGGRAAERGELSLEHVFRLLSLVLDRDAIRAAWRGITGDHGELGSLALEYLEQVLPEDVREKLWPFIGDLSVAESRRALRPLKNVIDELLVTGTTLFRGDDRDRLQDYLRPSEDDEYE